MEKIVKGTSDDISSGNSVCKYTCAFISLLTALYYFSNKSNITNKPSDN